MVSFHRRNRQKFNRRRTSDIRVRCFEEKYRVDSETGAIGIMGNRIEGGSLAVRGAKCRSSTEEHRAAFGTSPLRKNEILDDTTTMAVSCHLQKDS